MKKRRSLFQTELRSQPPIPDKIVEEIGIAGERPEPRARKLTKEILNPRPIRLLGVAISEYQHIYRRLTEAELDRNLTKIEGWISSIGDIHPRKTCVGRLLEINDI